MNILIVDDEQPMRQLVKIYLNLHGYNVSEAANGQEALSQVKRNIYDLLIVDWMMPDCDGTELCRRIRQFSNVPILMLTARNQLLDKIEGFESGADDYMTKPFEEAELVARIRALLRRAKTMFPERTETVHYKGLTMNIESREVFYEGKPLQLTALEFSLLQFMLSHPGQALTREQLIENVWGYDFDGDDRTVDSHIRNLRGKLRRAGDEDLIKTLWGVGYKLL